MRTRIAVIGGGVSGLACALRLAPRHAVTLFEREQRLGGHAHTVTPAGGQGERVDTGFIVFNETTYPRFTALLRELGVASQPTDMGLSVRDDETGFEYSRDTLRSLFAQKRNLVRPGFYRMLGEAVRFNREATQAVDETVDEFLLARSFSPRFLRHYLQPLLAAIWSSDLSGVGSMPMAFVARFFENHGFLRFTDLIPWRVVKGGSSAYVDALVRVVAGAAELRLGAHLVSVRRTGEQVWVRAEGAEAEPFDQVIFATHSDQALELLEDASADERDVLGSIGFAPNDVLLHLDTSVLPRRRGAWASWNYAIGRQAPDGLVTYHMNTVQRLACDRHYCVSLERPGAASAPIDGRSVLARIPYHHPVFNRRALEAQAKRALISGARNRTFYCGAYWYNGFHEDGLRSALEVVNQINTEAPA
jgi:predicted NAD/FAD-binding protein